MDKNDIKKRVAKKSNSLDKKYSEKNKKLAKELENEFENLEDLKDFFSCMLELISGKGLIL